jgi:hypothetical protein
MFAGQPVIQAGTVTITSWTVTSRFLAASGTKAPPRPPFYRDLTDRENSATIHSVRSSRISPRDHDVFKVITAHSGAVTIEAYTLPRMAPCWSAR